MNETEKINAWAAENSITVAYRFLGTKPVGSGSKYVGESHIWECMVTSPLGEFTVKEFSNSVNAGGVEPDDADILYALFSDASMFWCAQSFDDFAREFYSDVPDDEDWVAWMTKAREGWEGCEEEGNGLMTLTGLGSDELIEIMNGFNE